MTDCSTAEGACNYVQPTGCRTWRESDGQSIPAAAVTSGWLEVTPDNDSILRRVVPIASNDGLTAPGYATVDLKDQNGDVVWQAVHLEAVGMDSGPTVIQRVPHLHVALKAGVPFKYRINLSAAEGLAKFFTTAFAGEQSNNCLDKPQCLQGSACKPYAQSFVFAAAAGALPPDGTCKPDAPMVVDDVVISTSVSLDAGAETSVQLSQQGRPLAPATDVRMFLSNIIAGLPRFPVRYVDAVKPLQVAWGATAQTAANNFVVTLVGRRACKGDCPQ